jgi:glycosyltransferase involved in cell wall biosynthesis
MTDRPGRPAGDPGMGLGFPLVIATILREEGSTGVQTYVRQVRRYLGARGASATLVTPFSWGRALTVPVFGFRRLVLERCSGPADVVWYRHWHEVFLRHALRQRLRGVGDCVVFAQGPLAARAALRARRGPHQAVVMAVHFRVSQADEFAAKELIRRDGPVFRAVRQLEREVIPQVDRLVYVSNWGREALLSWLPEAAAVRSAVIGNFVAPLDVEPRHEPLGDLVTVGNLDLVKNHRYLLEVLAEAKRAGRSLTLDVFGEGPCRNDLLRQTSSLGLEAQVRLRGYQPGVRELLPGYRAYVHASYSESLPLAIIEAMAACLPVVAGDTGGVAELCDDGVEARFWPLDDPAKAAATLVGLLENEPARLKAARAASERFRRHLDADVVGPRLLSFLREAAPDPSALLKIPRQAGHLASAQPDVSDAAATPSDASGTRNRTPRTPGQFRRLQSAAPRSGA